MACNCKSTGHDIGCSERPTFNTFEFRGFGPVPDVADSRIKKLEHVIRRFILYFGRPEKREAWGPLVEEAARLLDGKEE